MHVHLHTSPDDFGPVARWVYRRDPVLFTTELTTLRTSRWPTGHLLLSVAGCDAPVGAALQIRDATLLVNGLPPESAKAVASALVQIEAELPAVRGTASAAAAFSQAWTEATGTVATTEYRETLYRLAELRPPAGVAGEPRPACDEDGELVARWLDAFFVEAFAHTSNPEASRGLLADIVAAGGRVVLWTVNGVPVAMARIHGCLLGMSRIGPVYTPPESRGRGFGAAVTAEAARHAERDGARDVVLYADVANPVSNRIYQRLGFVSFAENVQYAFSARGPHRSADCRAGATKSAMAGADAGNRGADRTVDADPHCAAGVDDGAAAVAVGMRVSRPHRGRRDDRQGDDHRAECHGDHADISGPFVVFADDHGVVKRR